MARDVKEKLFEIDSKKIELDFLQRQFLIECKRFTAQCIEGKFRKAISTHPQKTFELGKEGLIPIKDKMTRMMGSVSELVESVVNQDILWLHSMESLTRINFPENHYATNKTKGPQVIETELKKLFSPVGDLLLQNGLDTEQNWKTIDGMVIPRHTMEWSPEMSQCIEQYNDRFNELSKLVQEYEKLSKMNSGNDALDLWDSI